MHRLISVHANEREPRRPTRRNVAGAVAVLALTSGCAREPNGLPEGGPIVIIVVDTLRADGLGLYGYPHATSRPLDEWAERGAVFTHAFSTAPWTLPSVGSLLTGRYPANHGSGRREIALPEGGTRNDYVGLDAASPRLAARLSEHGYATAAFVTNSFLWPGFGLDRGFDSYDFSRSKFRDQRAADVMVDQALAWIDAREPAAPWFLLLHLLDPHLPYDPSPQVAGRLTAGYHGTLATPIEPGLVRKVNGGELELDLADQAFLRGVYDEEVAFVSAQLARFLEGLAARKVLERGLVLFTADHGEEFLDHGMLEHGHTLYQELLRIPFVVWGHGVRPGRRAEPVSLVDVMPTLLEALGLARREDLDGVSLWPALSGGSAPGPRRLFAENSLYGEPRRALVEWPFKLIASGDPARFELYDLERDPTERVNLATTRPEVSGPLTTVLAQRTRLGHERAAVELDQETQNDLRSIGYLGGSSTDDD